LLETTANLEGAARQNADAKGPVGSLHEGNSNDAVQKTQHAEGQEVGRQARTQRVHIISRFSRTKV
jgi:hypothetical protein